MSEKKRRDKYIDRAIAVMKQDGTRLTLEEIAAKMGITKKTLYNHFSSKDELLRESLRAISDDFRQALAVLDDPDHSAIEDLQISFDRVSDLLRAVSPVFFSDLLRMSRNQALLEHVVGSELFIKKMGANLRKGIDEGLYREEIDIDFFSHYIPYSIFGFYLRGLISNNPLIARDYFEEVLEYHLRAITTERGKELMSHSHE
jgi:AcrR family transcriptional regulator